jgi:hypothetical protein
MMEHQPVQLISQLSALAANALTFSAIAWGYRKLQASRMRSSNRVVHLNVQALQPVRNAPIAPMCTGTCRTYCSSELATEIVLAPNWLAIQHAERKHEGMQTS